MVVHTVRLITKLRHVIIIVVLCRLVPTIMAAVMLACELHHSLKAVIMRDASGSQRQYQR